MKKRTIVVVTITILVVMYILAANIYRINTSELLGYSKAALSYYGSRGNEVIEIQKRLSWWGYYDGAIDGIYGYQTYKAVRLFQYKNGLVVDGIAGPETLSALGLPTGQAATPTSAGPTGNKDINLLAHIIHGEARGEPYTGKVAVAAVILNRTRDSRFPKTIAGVIYQPGAFDAVSDGQINLEPDDSSYKAARDALNGWDPTYGCIYYWNPATATSKWVWSRQIVVTIGKHVFAK
ncbi:MAG: spore cortex-lytic enzyme [Acetivibrionales bacterium]